VTTSERFSPVVTAMHFVERERRVTKKNEEIYTSCERMREFILINR
jgi:hypothetical protein